MPEARSPEKFGIPCVTSYAATEFGGGVAELDTGPITTGTGRVSPARQRWAGPAWAPRLRVASRRTGRVLGSDRGHGLLEVKPGQLGAGRARTGCATPTDPARIDADGFLWIPGRAATGRSSAAASEVLPDDVRAALGVSTPADAGCGRDGRPDLAAG